MSKENSKLFSDEEIQKALETLNSFSEKETADTLIKSLDGEIEGNKETEDRVEKDQEVEKSNVDELIKSMEENLDSKFKSLATVNKFLVEENEALKSANEEILKSVSAQSETLNKVLELSEQMANSPLNKLGAIKKSVQIEKFGSEGNGKETLSLTRDRHKITQMLMKSLDTEEGQRRLGDVVPFVEQGYVNQSNAEFLMKSVQNELGGNYNITI